MGLTHVDPRAHRAAWHFRLTGQTSKGVERGDIYGSSGTLPITSSYCLLTWHIRPSPGLNSVPLLTKFSIRLASSEPLHGTMVPFFPLLLDLHFDPSRFWGRVSSSIRPSTLFCSRNQNTSLWVQRLLIRVLEQSLHIPEHNLISHDPTAANSVSYLVLCS